MFWRKLAKRIPIYALLAVGSVVPWAEIGGGAMEIQRNIIAKEMGL